MQIRSQLKDPRLSLTFSDGVIRAGYCNLSLEGRNNIIVFAVTFDILTILSIGLITVRDCHICFRDPKSDLTNPIVVGNLDRIDLCCLQRLLHPLRRFPGPKLWAAFMFPGTWSAIKGRLPAQVRDFHRAYDFVVRIGPNELAFANSKHGRRSSLYTICANK